MAERRPSLGPPPDHEVRTIVRRALAEDMPWGDVTTEAIVPPESAARGAFVAREGGVICGLPVATAIFAELDPAVLLTPLVIEGAHVDAGTTIGTIVGPARPLLAGERSALNLLQRMSGIATATARLVDAVAATGATIVDTRKTAPGLRALDKYAVRCGGGGNHRFSLSDAVLVKDNHIAAANRTLVDLLREVRGAIPHTMKVEVEVDRLDQIADALAGGADIILLDNMTPDQLRRAVSMVGSRALTEASGGITIATARQIAATGVDLISVGALTHSVQALDIGLDLYVQVETSAGDGRACEGIER